MQTHSKRLPVSATAVFITILLIAVFTCVHAETQPTFYNYSAAKQYVYKQIKALSPRICYTLILNDASGFDHYAETSCSSLSEIDDGIHVAGDFASDGLYNGDRFKYTQTGNKYMVNDEIQYLVTPAQQNAYEVKKKAVLKKLKLKGSTEKKVDKIYRYVCSHVRYDYKYKQQSAYDALVKGKATCNGYACLFYDLCRSSGIPCRIITGNANGYHAWNIVKIGKSWYNCDSTWDAGSKAKAYFLKGSGFTKTHKPKAAYRTAAFRAKYPMAKRNYKMNVTKNKSKKASAASGQNIAQQGASGSKLQQYVQYFQAQTNPIIDTIVKYAKIAYQQAYEAVKKLTKLKKEVVNSVQKIQA